MEFLRKVFGKTKMSWKLLICYSVITGVVVGLLNCVPALANTSLTYPAVSFEYWFVAAIFVIMNCENDKEAAIKTFIFFLISQPLIYIVEIPFVSIGWRVLLYYKNWIIPTILTLPGGWIAYQVKKDNILSAIILSVATGFLLLTGIACVKNVIGNFPYGILAAIFCLFFSFAFIFILLDKKNIRIIALVCTLLIAIPLYVVMFTRDNSVDFSIGYDLDSGHTWEIIQSDVEASITDDCLVVHSNSKGVFYITVKNEAGETIKFAVTLTNEQFSIEPIE